MKSFQDLSLAGFPTASFFHADTIIRHDFGTTEEKLCSLVDNFRASIDELVTGGGGRSAITQRFAKPFEIAGWNKRNFDVTTQINGIETTSRSHEVDHVYEFIDGDRVCTLALEIEWNTKNTFSHRDLENFRQLHMVRGIDAAVILCRKTGFDDDVVDMLEAYAKQLGLDSVEAVDDRIRGLAAQRVGQENLTGKSLKQTIGNRVRGGMPFHRAWAECFVASKYGTTTSEFGTINRLLTRGVGGACPILLIGLPSSRIDTTPRSI